MKHIRVAIVASDPVSQFGITSYLEAAAEVSVGGRDTADVVVFAAERLDAGVLSALRRVDRPIVLVSGEINTSYLVSAVECGVRAVLVRSATTRERLVEAVRAAAAGAGLLAPELVGELLNHVRRVHREVLEPRGLTATGFSQREIDVLRLLSDGFNTAEIAAKLCYSTRTVKNILQKLITRLKLNGRPHAVAYAIRAGII